MQPVSLSTCWCSSRHTDGYEMVAEMVELGFNRIELSHGIRISLVPGILKAVEEGLVEISTVHNFCPLPNGVMHAAPNLFQPSSGDKRERSLWARHSLQTFEFARKVGAPRVVMHSGSEWFFFSSPEAKLDRVAAGLECQADDLHTDKAFARARDRALARIRRKAPKYMERIVEGYKELLPKVRELGLQLALENREGLEELPLDEAWPDFLAELDAPDATGYWHDCGHGRIKHQMGVLDHRAQLEANAERLIGFHLHDVSVEGRDHQVPGSGTVDFEMIRDFVQPDHTLVLELSPRLSTEQVLASRDFVESWLG